MGRRRTPSEQSKQAASFEDTFHFPYSLMERSDFLSSKLTTYQLSFAAFQVKDSVANARELVKRYFRARIAFWRPATFRPYLKHIKPFFARLSEQYPDLDSFAPLTRAMIEPVLHFPYWMDQEGKRHPITGYRRAKMAGVLEGMFTYMRLHDWPEAPPKSLIFYEDKLGRPVRRPRPIPDSVMQQLDAHLHLLHPYARNLVEILRVAGLRAEDALHLQEDGALR